MLKLNRTLRGLFSGGVKGHFGQWAEDVLVRKLFPKSQKLGTYLDLGAYHPFIHSNTAYFWMQGWRGFNIDANPDSIRLFDRIRTTDTNVWTAIIPRSMADSGAQSIDLFFPQKRDTNDRISATASAKQSIKTERQLTESIQVPACSIAQLVERINIQEIDYLNIDIEGFDLDILSDINFSRLSPFIISVEDYAPTMNLLQQSPITTLLNGQGYELVARAGLTSIFRRA